MSFTLGNELIPKELQMTTRGAKRAMTKIRA